MKCDERTGYKLAVAVAVACMEDERPKGEYADPENAAQYLCQVLQVLFSHCSIHASAEPLVYPRCSKIPLIIRLSDVGECLFWYYPYANAGDVAAELEGALYDLALKMIPASA